MLKTNGEGLWRFRTEKVEEHGATILKELDESRESADG
jgi:hypothetical protein